MSAKPPQTLAELIAYLCVNTTPLTTVCDGTEPEREFRPESFAIWKHGVAVRFYYLP